MLLFGCPHCNEAIELSEDLLVEDEQGEEYLYCPMCEDVIPLEELFGELRKASRFWGARERKQLRQMKRQREVARSEMRKFRRGEKGAAGRIAQGAAGDAPLLRDIQAMRKKARKAYISGAKGYVKQTAAEKKAMLKSKLSDLIGRLKARFTPKSRKQLVQV